MVVTNDGKNRIRDLIVADISSVELGTDGTNATIVDTDLGVGVASTNAVPTITTGNKILNISHTTLSTVANGSTLREAGIFLNSDTIMLDRIVFPDIAKVDSIEITTIDLIRVN